MVPGAMHMILYTCTSSIRVTYSPTIYYMNCKKKVHCAKLNIFTMCDDDCMQYHAFKIRISNANSNHDDYPTKNPLTKLYMHILLINLYLLVHICSLISRLLLAI